MLLPTIVGVSAQFGGESRFVRNELCSLVKLLKVCIVAVVDLILDELVQRRSPPFADERRPTLF